MPKTITVSAVGDEAPGGEVGTAGVLGEPLTQL